MLRCRMPAWVSADSNCFTALASFLGAGLCIYALMCPNWIVDRTNPNELNGAWYNDTDQVDLLIEQLEMTPFSPLSIYRCHSIGPIDFILPARFTSLEFKAMVDCVNPTVANYFYMIIAVLLVAVLCGYFSMLLNVSAAPLPFFDWLRMNLILEFCTVIMLTIAEVLFVLARRQMSQLRPHAHFDIKTAFLLMTISSMFFCAGLVYGNRRNQKLRHNRRLDNQRLICTRTLRSWRDVAQRAEDRRPIIDFERYLLEPGLRRNHEENGNQISTISHSEA